MFLDSLLKSQANKILGNIFLICQSKREFKAMFRSLNKNLTFQIAKQDI